MSNEVEAEMMGTEGGDKTSYLLQLRNLIVIAIGFLQS